MSSEGPEGPDDCVCARMCIFMPHTHVRIYVWYMIRWRNEKQEHGSCYGRNKTRYLFTKNLFINDKEDLK